MALYTVSCHTQASAACSSLAPAEQTQASSSQEQLLEINRKFPQAGPATADPVLINKSRTEPQPGLSHFLHTAEWVGPTLGVRWGLQPACAFYLPPGLGKGSRCYWMQLAAPRSPDFCEAGRKGIDGDRDVELFWGDFFCFVF